MPLTLTINGQARDFDILNPLSNLAEIVERMELQADRIAVELNGVIAPRTHWPEIQVTSGDRIEIVHFVGGGISGMDKGTGSTIATSEYRGT